MAPKLLQSCSKVALERRVLDTARSRVRLCFSDAPLITRPMAGADAGADGGADGGQLAVQMPERLTIGTKKAFDQNYPFPYQRRQIDSETIYVCSKGSQWARGNEVLVLRCERGIWTAFDSAVSADGSTLQCRQPVFRCLATDITQPGWHTWQINYAASRDVAGLVVDWEGALSAETRVP